MFKLLGFLVVVFGSSCDDVNENISNLQPRTHKLLHYSEIAQDTFVVDVFLPDTSGEKPSNVYPVIYILDANLYFEIYASILKQYNSVGLVPKVILVGVGYPTFQKMDSLRQRDYTYPEAIPEYEMPVSGKADAFRRVFAEEFVPLIDSLYATDTTKRILMGHSLGGYFSLYAMYQDQLQQSLTWMGYIAASPSLHYNNSYLVDKFKSLVPVVSPGRKVFISYGQDEAAGVHEEIHMSLDSLLLKCTEMMERTSALDVHTVVFSSMDHMDTQLPSFIKGLQWMLQDKPAN